VNGLNLASNNLSGTTPASFGNLTGLTTLNLSGNGLTSVDISTMPALVNCNLGDNRNLSTVTKNNTAGYYPNINKIILNNCRLSAFNTRGMESVVELRLEVNQLTTLDISQLSRLATLVAHNNQLTQLLTNPSANYYSQLYAIEVWQNQLTAVDISTMPALVTCDLNANHNLSILTKNNTAGYYPNIQTVWLYNCNLSTFNATGMESVVDLQLYFNQLTTLDISQLSRLRIVLAYSNQLTQLLTNPSANYYSQLRDFRVQGNQLTSVDISTMPDLYQLRLDNNPNLATLTKSNTIGYYSRINQVNLSGCKLSAFNTTGMESVIQLQLEDNQLTTLDISRLFRLESLLARRNQLTQLITNPAANYYSRFSTFYASYNQLTSVNISNMQNLGNCHLSYNPNLTLVRNNTAGYYPNIGQLYLNNCNLSAFNMTGMESVFDLRLDNNQLTTLDISQLFRVGKVRASNNQLTQLITNPSINYYSRLVEFHASANQLTSIDISTMPALLQCNLEQNPNLATVTKNNTAGYYPNIQVVYLSGCKLSAFNTRGMEAVIILQLNDNQTTTLEISQANYYSRLYRLEIQNNKLTFEDIEPLVGKPTIYQYSPQAEVEASYNNQTRTLSVQVGGTANRYQWKKNGVNIPGATSTTLVLTGANFQGNDQYQCVITNTIATKLTLYSQLLRPRIDEPPFIYSISPSAGPLGTLVTINGKGFDAVPANNVVYFGAVKAGVITASPTQLTVNVPAGATSVVPVTVTCLSRALGASSITATSSPVMFNLAFQSLANLRYAYERSDVSLSTTPLNVVAGDVNGDDLVDLVVTNFAVGTVSVILRSAGNAGFEPAIQYGVGIEPRDIAIADYNGDGKQDIAISNNGSSNVSLLIRRSDNTGFEPVSTLAVEVYPNSIVAGDINGDGRIDLVTTNNKGFLSILLRKADNSGFELAVIDRFRFNDETGFVDDGVLGDFNGDGRIDIAVTDYVGTPAISILMRKADNTGFEPLSSFPLTATPCALAVGDFNNDGKIDVAASIYGLNTVALLYRKGDNTDFEAAQYLPVSRGPSGPYGITVGDFNGDGKADIATSDTESYSISVLLRRGDNTGFEPGIALAAGAGLTPQSINTADFNKDGKADLVAAHANIVSILTYQLIVANPSYTICAGESATLQAQAAGTIRWYDAATGGNVLHTGANFVVTPSSTRQYWVDAQESGFFSSRKEVTVTVNSAPSEVISTTTLTATTFTANWSAVSGATGYRLDVSTSNTFVSLVAGYSNLSVTGTSQPVTGLTAGTTYYYRVRAVSSCGTSANSNVITVTLPAACPGDFVWAQQSVHTSAGTVLSYTIALDASGNSYVTGYFVGTATFGSTSLTSNGSQDVFVAKYNASGALLWVRQAGGAGFDGGWSIKVDASGNSYVTGAFRGTATFSPTTSLTSAGNFDAFVAKYDASGTLQWVRQVGGANYSFGADLAVDAVGNSYVTGPFVGPATFSPTTSLTSTGSGDVFVAKYDASGILLWVRQAGGTDNDQGRGIALDASGNSYVTGSFSGTATFGSTTLTSTGSSDVFVAKYDASGTVLWAKQAGGSNGETVYGIAVDASGNSYMTGNFSGTATFGSTSLTSTGSDDIFVAKCDASGTVLWAKKAGGATVDEGRGITVDAVGNSYVTGNFSGTATFGSTSLISTGSDDIFVAKYDASGILLWVRQAGGTDNDQGRGIALDASGNSYVTGPFASTANFGSTTLTSTDGSDIFVAKLSAPASITASPASAIVATSFTANWSAVSGATGYQLDVSTSNTFSSFVAGYNNLSVTGTSQPVTGLTAGTAYYYRVRSVSACGTSTNSNIITITLPTIFISATTAYTICAGNSVTLQAQVAGTIRWYDAATGGNVLHTGANFVVTPSSTRQYWVDAQESGFFSSRKEVTVTVNPTPSAAITTTTRLIFCIGETVSVNMTTAGGTFSAYQWQKDEVNIVGATGPNYTATTRGNYRLKITNTSGCTAYSNTLTITEQPALTATLTRLRGVSCATATDARLELRTNATSGSYTLYRNNIAGSPLPFSGSTLSFNSLSSGTYRVVLTNAQGCIQTSNSLTLEEGGPVATVCPVQLPCEGAAQAVVYFNLSYPDPPADFSGRYQYRILKNNVEVIPSKLATSNNSTGTDPLYGNPGAVYAFQEAIPNAQAGDQITVEVTAYVPGTAGCNCFVPVCTKNTPFAFEQAEPTLALNSTGSVDGTPVYYVCQANASASVGITFGKTLFNCSAPFNGGYLLTLKPANGPSQVLAQSSQTTSSVQIQQTLSLLPGKYQLTGELGPGNYRCRKTVDFEVISLGNLSVSVRTTGADCQGGTAAAVVSGGIGQLSYRWLRTTAAGQVLETLGNNGSAYSASQVSGLRAGHYRLEASLLGSGASCIIPASFVIDSLASATWPLVAGQVCGGLARAKALTLRGQYRFDWYAYPDNTQTPRKDSLLFSEFVRPLANDSLISHLSELAADSAWYYVVMTDPQGCALSSLTVKLRKPRFDRTYSFCLRWGVPAPRPQPAQPSSVQTLAAITASNVRQTLEEKASNCLTLQQKLVEQKLNVTCLEPGAVRDTLWLSYPQRYHHFTLYYYDRAGSLVKTVPPAGVNPQTTASRLSRPAHELATTYQYNSLGQLMRQATPDADTTNFVYNRSGQLRFSQNARQRADNTYSYTKYDELSRVAEVGQASAANATQSPVFNALTAHSQNEALLTNDTTRTLLTTQRFPLAGVSSLAEQTVTVYSEPKNNVSYFGKSRQRNLQNRVSYTYTYNRADSSRAVYTYYSYDPHGNVEWMVQEIPGLPRNYLAYEYDLISGKVLQVKYNEHQTDRFFHRYQYDEDNRLTQVETSRDGYVWDRDAQYEYYRHGPLKRTGLGEDKVQGLDFAYTIQGWLKGINSPVGRGAASDTLDLGKDGIRADNPYSRDVFGMALHYYKGDYQHSGSAFHSPSVINAATTAANRFNLPPTRDLYNGNIAGWVTNTSGPTNGRRIIEGNQFGYDRLNRLKSSGRQSWNPTTQAWRPLSDTLRTNYSYDGSGNLLTLNRRDDKGARLDSLVYSYETRNGRKSNRLKQVTDRTSTTAYPDDLEGTSLYTYDKIGNLILDQKEGVAIDWNVYGKVSQVRPADTTSKKPYVRYLYDAAGNRVAKEVTLRASPGTSRPGLAKVKTTYYARDAQGNTMAVYERTVAQQAAGVDRYRLTVRQAEVPLYGSDRLGMFVPDSTFLLNNLYTKAQLDSGVTLPATHYQRQIENHRMLTAGNRGQAMTDSLSRALTLAWAKRMPIRANLWRVDTVGISPFAGRMGRNLAVGETLTGRPEVYAVTAADYWGAAHTTLVSDTTGKLLVNSDSIRADARAKSLLVRRPGQAGQYFLVTTDTTGALLLHTVDARAGKVSEKNRVLGSSGYRYGRQLTALEDRSTEQVYLYATRHKNGTSELVVLTLDSLGQQAQQTLVREAGVDEQGEDELQLSPDGKQLVWYQLGNRLGWFSHRQMQPKVYKLSEDHLSVSNGRLLTLPNGDQATDLASLDFDQNSQTVTYSQRGLATTATWQVTLSSNALSKNNVNAGGLRRGQDGIVHLEAGGLPVQVHTLLAPDLSTAKAGIAYRSVGQKQYELNDHLGNVRVVVGDEKLATLTPQGSSLSMDLRAAVRSYFHYYPFGMNQPGGVYGGDTLRSYRYGFNGQEKGSEISEGIYTAEFWQYDSRIGRRWNIDPIDKPWISPYHAFSNKPILNIDPNGANDGDYYSKDGKKLGSDGKNDDKAYVSDKATIENATQGSITDWQKVKESTSTTQLSVTNSTLGMLARAIAEEYSGDRKESYALASAIINLSNYRGKTVQYTLENYGIYGYNGSKLYNNSEYSLEGSINALTGGIDYSVGAIRWDGFDLAARGFNHIKARQFGFEISENNFSSFKAAWPDATIESYSSSKFKTFSTNFSSGIHIATEGENMTRCLYKSTVVHGKTIFWGVNKDPVTNLRWAPPLTIGPIPNLFNLHHNIGYKKWKSL
jgi:Leucine-rich repeat (LRR) protein